MDYNNKKKESWMLNERSLCQEENFQMTKKNFQRFQTVKFERIPYSVLIIL